MSRAFLRPPLLQAFATGEPKSFEQLEQELLNGQKLQGVLTSNEVQEIITIRQW